MLFVMLIPGGQQIVSNNTYNYFFILLDNLSAQESLDNCSIPVLKPDQASQNLDFEKHCDTSCTDEQAVGYYQNILEKNPCIDENQRMIIDERLGKLYFHKKNYDSAIVYLKAASDSYPEMLEQVKSHAATRAFLYLAFCYINAGDTAAGQRTLTEHIEKLYGIHDYEKIEYCCELCETSGLFLDEAFSWAAKSSEKCEADFDGERIKAALIADSSMRRKTEDSLNVLLENYYQILNTYGELAGLTNRYSDAIHAWEKVLKLPDCIYSKIFKPLSNAYIAAIYIKSGNAENGERLISEMLDNPTDTTDALFFLPVACSKFRVETKEAIHWAEEGLKIKSLSTNCWLYDAYAELLFEDGQIDKAVLWEIKAYQNLLILQFKDKIEKFKNASK